VQGVLAALGIILGAMYLLYMLQRTIFGPVKPSASEAADAGPVEMVAIVPLALLLVILGIFPSLLINVQKPAVELIVASIGGGA
jgi:NADH-quinone oxidoreductase subunit M